MGPFQPSPINHEHLYPNLLPVREYVENLVSFCERAYRTLEKKVSEDEQRNASIEYSQQEFIYKKSFGAGFKVHLYTNANASLDYETADSLLAAAREGRLNDVSRLSIRLDLDYMRGKNSAFEEHNNEFEIAFIPFNTKFTRSSNYVDPDMDSLEDEIVRILEDFPFMKTIFTPEK